MKVPNISESQWTVMEALWEHSPQTASSVAKALYESTGWAENTVRNLLTRLLEKGALEIADPGVQPKQYVPGRRCDRLPPQHASHPVKRLRA